MAGLASAVVEHVEQMVSRRLEDAEARQNAMYAEAVEVVQGAAEQLADCDRERAELVAQVDRLRAREAELDEARRQHVAARAGYEDKRRELSRALVDATAGQRPPARIQRRG